MPVLERETCDFVLLYFPGKLFFIEEKNGGKDAFCSTSMEEVFNAQLLFYNIEKTVNL
jgi:hypothetical protein